MYQLNFFKLFEHKLLAIFGSPIFTKRHRRRRAMKPGLRISQEIIIQNEKNLDSFYLDYMGWIKTKNHLTLLSL
jgi:hypothetical protein